MAATIRSALTRSQMYCWTIEEKSDTLLGFGEAKSGIDSGREGLKEGDERFAT